MLSYTCVCSTLDLPLGISLKRTWCKADSSIASAPRECFFTKYPAGKIAKKQHWRREFLLNRHWKFSAIYTKIHSSTLLFLQFCRPGSIIWLLKDVVCLECYIPSFRVAVMWRFWCKSSAALVDLKGWICVLSSRDCTSKAFCNDNCGIIA